MGWNNWHDRLDASFSYLGGDKRAFERWHKRSAQEDQARNQILRNQAHRRAHPDPPPQPRKSVRFANDPASQFGMRSWNTILDRNRFAQNPRPMRAQRGPDGYMDYLNYAGPSPCRVESVRRKGSLNEKLRWQQEYGLSDREVGLNRVPGYYGGGGRRGRW